MNQDTLKIISTWAGLLPVLAGFIVFKKAGFNYRLFTLFLLYGFLTDIAVGYFISKGLSFESRSIFYIYGLGEALFFFWFIYHISENAFIRKTAFFLMLIVPFAWAAAHIDFNVGWKHEVSGALYTTLYEMTITLLASWSILQLTQKSEPLQNDPAFWFLTGIFVLCLCTFLVVSFLEERDVRNKLWFVQNVTNIITYFIYTFGFFRIETKKVS